MKTIEIGKIGIRSSQSARGWRMGLLGLAYLVAMSGAALAQTYIEFNAIPLSINTAGTITGSSGSNGFVGTAGGTITTFDVSGAVATVADSINSAGVIAGHWGDANAVNHGFVRAADGTITTFDAAGAGKVSGQGTVPKSINADGVIAGIYHVAHGFVRSADGTITEFSVSSAGNATPASINTDGVITGYYSDASGVYHGFVRSASGTIMSFDAPGAGTTGDLAIKEGTFAESINDDGVITGYYVDSCGGYHGFVGTAGGTITTINAPGAGTCTSPLTGYSLGTKALSINDDGAITGWYIDPNDVYHGFMVSASGAITTFNAPGASTSGDTGTYPTSINDNGVIVGYYSASSPGDHGFQLTP
jgi:hypothetical protein